LDKGGEWDEEEEGAFAEQKNNNNIRKNYEHWKNNSYSIP
jgi:hypothetical protein